MEYLILFRITNLEWLDRYKQFTFATKQYIKTGFETRHKAEEFSEKFKDMMSKETYGCSKKCRYSVETLILSYYRCDKIEVDVYFLNQELPEELYKDIM